MPNDERAAHGVDPDRLDAFTDHVAEHPEEVTLGLGARSTYEGTCGHSLSKVDGYTLGDEVIVRETREYTIPYGSWKEVLDAGGWVGATDRIDPIEGALAALAACINVGITVNAVANGVDVEGLQTRVRTEFDPRVLFGLADLTEADAVFENLTVEIEIEGEDLDKDLVDEWARRAPVYTLVSHVQDVEVTITTPAELSSADPRGDPE